MAVASGLLGLAVFFVIRVLPLRIIDRTFAQLEATQARLLATIDAIPVEFMEYDREGRMMLINGAARISQGWTAESLGRISASCWRRPSVSDASPIPDTTGRAGWPGAWPLSINWARSN